MKKGVVGTIIGVVFFFFAINILFVSGNTTIASFTPFIFIIMFSIVIPLISKKAKESQSNPNDKDNLYNRYNDSKYGNTISSKTNCHKCNLVIEKTFKYCPYCGASQRDTIICEYCGHENPKENALCENCNGFL